MSFCVAGVAPHDILTCLKKAKVIPQVIGSKLSSHFRRCIVFFVAGAARRFRHVVLRVWLHTSTLYTQHLTLHTQHLTLNTPHLTLFHNLHFTLHTLHFTPSTQHSALCTWHSTFHTLHLKLCTPHSTLYTPTLYTPTLYTTHFTLCMPYSTLHPLRFTVPTPHCTLYTTHMTLYRPDSRLYIPPSTLEILRFTLYISNSAAYNSKDTGENIQFGKMYVEDCYNNLLCTSVYRECIRVCGLHVVFWHACWIWHICVTKVKTTTEAGAEQCWWNSTNFTKDDKICMQPNSWGGRRGARAPEGERDREGILQLLIVSLSDLLMLLLDSDLGSDGIATPFCTYPNRLCLEINAISFVPGDGKWWLGRFHQNSFNIGQQAGVEHILLGRSWEYWFLLMFAKYQIQSTRNKWIQTQTLSAIL